MANPLWVRWKRFAHRAAELQSLVILTIVYWVVVVPIGMLRPSARERGGPAWRTRPADAVTTLPEARRQS